MNEHNTGSGETKESKGGRVVAFTVVGVLALAAAGYAGAYAGAGAKVPRGAEVAGIKIGGLEEAAAVAKLDEAIGGRKQVKVTVDGQQTSVPVSELGITFDADATVAEAGGGRSWSPGRLWDYYTGGKDVEPVTSVDAGALERVLTGLDEQFGKVPVDGKVSFRKGDVRTSAPADGRGIDRDRAEDALVDAVLHGGTAELALTDVAPEIDEADVQEALDEFANPAVSAAVTLNFEGTKVQLAPKAYTKALSLEPRDGSLEPVLDEERLDKLVRNKMVGRDDAPVDATVKLVKGKPKVVPAKPGVDFATEDITSTFLDLVVKPAGERQAEVEAQVSQPDFTTEDAEALGIKEEISSFTTYYPPANYRNVNIGRAAEKIDGTVLKPGEVFSMNDIVGERTVENGFTTGTIISNGVFKEDLGGGVSQMATTTFNAMFFAGLEDVEHKPHSFYIDRYPVGREATVAWGSVDLRFRNNTDYGVLISAKVTPGYSSNGVVTVKMYSTKIWDITTKTSDRYNYRGATTRYVTTPGCVANAAPSSGFDVDVFRYFHKPGKKQVEKTEKFHTAYIAVDRVVCGPPPGQNDNKNKNNKNDDD
ncbi:VanW family protein [Nocardioides alcanivorans]|uniref:VanW family protein n=1 Tax=Nocardioides alcanivorans TaxID=2897352 RepID=UPI001F4110B2|nr:VanW family protein [Nocardioides alcanivorans]